MSKWEPACMSAEEYADWKAANALCYRRERVLRPCADCISSFRNENLLAGTCNGAIRRDRRTPSHNSKRLIQWRESHARKRAGIRVRRSPSEVEALAFQARNLRALGATYVAIGRRLGIDQTYARDLCLREAA